MKKKAQKKTKKKIKKAIKSAKLTKPVRKKKAKTYEHHPDHYNKSEAYLTQNLEPDLKDAWDKIRTFGESFGDQRIYASGRAIMFSKKVCYFFVRPQKAYLEVVLFLNKRWPGAVFKSIRPVSKTKFAHTFRLVHGDQVEGDLADALRQAFDQTEGLA